MKSETSSLLNRTVVSMNDELGSCSSSIGSSISRFYLESGEGNSDDNEIEGGSSSLHTSILWRRLSELIRFTLSRSHRLSLSSNIGSKPQTPNTGNAEKVVLLQDESNPIAEKRSKGIVLCRLCLSDYLLSDLISLERSCGHRFCANCLKEMITLSISEGRIMIECPLIECNQYIHPSDISQIVGEHNPIILKYEQFMVRRVLLTIPDSRWCPVPDCSYAVIATGCASCPLLTCELCNTEFCYHCQQLWHPNQTCKEAAANIMMRASSTSKRASKSKRCTKSSGSSRQQRKNRDRRGQIWLTHKYDNFSYTAVFEKKMRDSIKRCPCCKVAIMKVDDGSCNHMTCSQCGSEFCWLCLKIITDLHFLSPSGCTFWGRKRWSQKKKILWQCVALLGAPIGISLAACVSVPAIFVGLPVWAGRKTYKRLTFQSKKKRNIAVCLTSISALLAAPVIATITVVVGVPVLLTYTYAVIPMSMCKNDGCLDVNTVTNDELLIEDCDEDWLLTTARNSFYSCDSLGCSESSSVMLASDRSKQRRSCLDQKKQIRFANSLDSFSPINNRASFLSCFDACGTASGIVNNISNDIDISMKYPRTLSDPLDIIPRKYQSRKSRNTSMPSINSDYIRSKLIQNMFVISALFKRALTTAKTKLSKNDVNKALKNLPGWISIEEDSNSIERSFEFKNFNEAFSFLTKVAMLSEKINHHPEIHNVYNKVQLKLITHSQNGVTFADLTMAKKINEMLSNSNERNS
ncbi:hypothetical protein GJ496_008614 [Pomphorhynchus laevis]|nr:hypothetical protein GJ496_008614 [Pomphorhynchus laevis]